MKQVKGNCLIAQSGGPTGVINASAYGCIKEFLSYNSGYTAYTGMYGIGGILKGKISDMGKISEDKLETLKYMPSSALGSCRFKLKDYKEDEKTYIELFKIFEKLNIKYFFYIGGNDSMDTVCKISAYAKEKRYEFYAIGVPKTIDNDLEGTDHCPGFGSTAKYVANTGLEIWYDINTYDKTSIMVLEVMGRDAGWIAASAGILEYAAPDMNIMILLPEVPFEKQKFINDAKSALEKNNKLLIVTSEGIKDEDGDYVSAQKNDSNKDMFGHKQLGGAGKYLKNVIKENITNEVKLTELGVIQRCSFHCISKTDLTEAEMAGRHAVRYGVGECMTGYMAGLVRVEKKEGYDCITQPVKLEAVCNRIRHIPREWINENGTGVTKEMINYVMPLIQGEVNAYSSFGILNYNNFNIFRQKNLEPVL